MDRCKQITAYDLPPTQSIFTQTKSTIMLLGRNTHGATGVQLHTNFDGSDISPRNSAIISSRPEQSPLAKDPDDFFVPVCRDQLWSAIIGEV